MPKRHRSQSIDGTVPTKKKGNLKAVSLLDRVLNFHELSQPRGLTDACLESAESLLEFMQASSIMSDDECISRKDLIQVVLPWATRHIVARPSSDVPAVIWNAVATSMSAKQMIEQQDDEYPQMFSQLLSQSTLFKLVPKTALFAITLPSSAASSHAVQALRLVAPHWSPTLDVACNTLLIPVTTSLKGNPGLSSDDVETILTCVVDLLHRLFTTRKGNPKTTFTLFVRAPVLTALAHLYQRVAGPVRERMQQFIWQGLFESKHHMEGFVSLLAKAKLPMLDGGEGEGSSTSTFKCYQQSLFDSVSKILSEDSSAAMGFVPVLLQGFILQSRLHHSKTAATSRNIVDASVMQFHVFSLWSIPLLRRSTANTVSALERMLHLVLSEEVYTPSLDPREAQLGFLRSCSVTIVALLKDPHPTIQQDCLTIIKTLMQLHPALIHDNLDDVLDASLASDCNESTIAWLEAAWETYGALRQPEHLLEALLKVSDQARLETSISSAEVAAAVSQTIQASPQQQVQDMLSRIEEWLLRASTLPPGGVILIVLVLSNLPIRAVSAEVIGELCKRIDVALEQYLRKPVTITSALTLSGWVWEVQARCAFWKDDVKETPSPVVLQRLNRAVRNDTNENGPDEMEALVFLAGHRLRQLHSLLYQHERQTWEDPSLPFRTEIVDEACAVARFMGRRLGPNCPRVDVLWCKVAQSFGVWTPYADGEHIDWFLDRLFTILATEDSLESCSEAGEIALVLWKDASFLEHVPVSSRVHRQALVCTVHQVEWVLASFIRTQEVAKVLTVSETVGDSYPAEGDLLVLLSGCTKVGAIGTETLKLIIKKLGQSIRPLLLVNGVSALRAQQMGSSVYLALKLDHVLRSLGASRIPELENVVLPWIGVVRFFASNIVMTLNEAHGSSLHPDTLLIGLLRSTLDIVSRQGTLKSVGMPQLLLSTNFMEEEVVRRNVSTHNALYQAVAHLANGTLKEMDSHTLCALATLSRPFLKSALAGAMENTSTEGFVSLLKVLWKLAFDLCGGFGEDMASFTAAAHGAAEGFMLMGDLICLSEIWQPSSLVRHRKLLADQCLNWIALDENREMACHVLGCLSLAEVDWVERLCNVAVGTSSAVFDATVCSVVSRQSPEAQHIILVQWTGPPNATTSRRLSLLRLILPHLKEDAELGKVARNAMALALETLQESRSDSDTWTNNVETACGVIGDLVKERDCLLLTTTDLTLILSQICSLLGTTSVARNVSLSDVVYDAAGQLFQTLFARYTRHLYTCAPSVLSALHCFLWHALHLPGGSDQDVLRRGAIWTRLCQILMPHRDIYKKHSVGLLLEYINVAPSLSMQHREALQPATFRLIDQLSKFELDHLNAQLDVQAKAFFARVYQSYNKSHAYKGQ